MKKQLLFLALVLPVLSLVFYSCTNSQEDDVIMYVPKQVRELVASGETTKTKTTYSLQYDSEGNIKTEGDTLQTVSLYYSVDYSIDSALFVVANIVKEQEEKEAIENGIPEDEVSVTDSLKAIYTHSSSDIAIEVYTYRSQGDHDTTYQQILLNANLLPTSYTAGEREERYSYDAENRLASLELYDNNTLTRKLSYSYSGIKSPYDEVPNYPAWYFVVYRHMSPVELITKATVEDTGQAAYELSGFTISDLMFMTHATKAYYEASGTRTVTYRQDYQKVVIK